MSKGSKPKYDASASTSAQTAANQAAMATNARAANRTGPFGSVTTQVDQNGIPTGQTTAFSDAMQPGVNNTQAALNTTTSWLPKQQFSANVNADEARSAVRDAAMVGIGNQWRMADKANEVRMAERGIPIGSEVWRDVETQTGIDRGNQMTQLEGQVYQLGAQEEQRQRNNQMQDYMLPYEQAQRTQSLLGGYNQFLPQAPAIPMMTPVNAQGAYDQAYKAQLDAYNAEQQGWQNALKLGAGLATAPMTGGTSLIGMGASRLFNTPQAVNPYAASGGPY